MSKTKPEYHDNPVLTYHLTGQSKGRLRSQTAVVVIAAAFVLLAYLFLMYQVALYGMDLFGLAVFEMLIISLILPAASHSLISSEHERATWDSLMLTALSAREIFIGKWLSRAALLGIIVFAWLPIYLMAMAKETNITLYQLIVANLIIIGWGCVLISLSIWLSSLLKNSLGAAAVSFSAQVAGLMFLPLLLGALFPGFIREADRSWRDIGDMSFFWMFQPEMIYWLNPFITLYQTVPSSGLFAGDRLFGWGIIQSTTYGLLAILLCKLTTRAIRLGWRKR